MQFHLLGTTAALRDGAPVLIPPGKPRVILAALLCHGSQPVSVARLSDCLWEERPPPSARNALQVHVSMLRKSLDPGVLQTVPGGYRLHVGPDDLDTARFMRMADAGRSHVALGELEQASETLRAALALWRGPALADLSAYRFAEIEASRLEAARLAALKVRLEVDLAFGRHQRLIGELEHLVTLQPFDEELRGLAMLALYRAGRQADAFRLYTEGQRQLLDELGLDPGPALQALHGRLLRQDATLVPAVEPTAEASTRSPRRAPSTNTPQPRPIATTELIGRSREVADVLALLRQPGVRLVALVGPGGVGKTRLGWAVASALEDEFPGGIFIVPLDAVRNRHDATVAVGRALGVHGTDTHNAIREIVAEMEGRKALIVLDNVEQIPDLAVDIAALLQGSPALVLLATSRTSMGLAANHDFLVPPLAVPDRDAAPSVLLSNASVRLFIQRAAAADRSFTVEPASARDVAAICARLDGMPLAIELAAARVRVLSPGEILGRLDHQLELLAGGNAGRPERQRAMRLSIDWSYGLLAEGEANVFSQLAVFAAGCTLPAAENVCFVSTPGEGVDDEVLAAVAGLLDKGLLVRERRNGTARFRMLETVREYALERLMEGGNEDRLRRRHADYFACRAERDAVRIHEHLDAGTIAQFDLDIDNFVSALSWSRDAGEVELLGRLAAGLSDYWYLAGRIRQGAFWTGQALAMPLRPQERGVLLHAAGNLSINIDCDPSSARKYYLAARAVFVDLDEGTRAARSCDGITFAALCEGDIALAESAAAEGIVLAREAGANAVLGHLLGWLGEIALSRGDLGRAVDFWTEELALATASGLPNALTEPLSNLALGALAQAEISAAAELSERSLAGARLTGSPLEIGMVLLVCGLTSLKRGRLGAARDCFAESLTIRRGSGQLVFVAESIAALAVVDIAEGQMQRAALLISAAERLCEDNGTVLALPGIKTQYDPYFEQLHDALGSAVLDAASAAGRTMSLNEAANYALLSQDASSTKPAGVSRR